MAETAPSLGSELKFYRERSALEYEYGAKLATLAKKFYDKKNKKSTVLSVGETPRMTPGSLECSTLNVWTSHLNTLETRASDLERLANDLVSQVADPLKALASKLDDLRRRHVDSAEKLEHELEASFADLRKVKARYDATCADVEARRKKVEVNDKDKEKAKAQSAYQQQRGDMNNAKNAYLVAIAVANRHQSEYYHRYLPELLDSLQELSEFKTLRLNQLWVVASGLEKNRLHGSADAVDRLASVAVAANDPRLDSTMFLQHNAGGFEEPAAREFEPSPVWHDDALMIVDEPARIYLRNFLNRAKGQLGDMRRDVDKKRRELEGTRRVQERIRAGTEDKDEADVVRQIFDLHDELHTVDRKRSAAEVETQTIIAAVGGDVTLGAQNHNFKVQTFKIPTNCDLCGDRIWGLSAKGMDCRDCGYACHAKCEMKVPAECPGEQTKDERKKLKVQRQEAANALLVPSAALPDHVVNTAEAVNAAAAAELAATGSAVAAAGASSTASLARSSLDTTSTTASATAGNGRPAPGSRRNRTIAPPPSTYISELPANNDVSKPAQRKGTMLYDFTGSGRDELSVAAGREIVLLEADAGDGWIKIRAGHKEGRVPASYAELDSSEIARQVTGQSLPRPASALSNSGSSAAGSVAPSAKKKGPAVAPRRGAKKLRYVQALYEYSPQSDQEHSLTSGERVVLVREDTGDGWIDVEKGGVTKSVPASYVDMV